MTPKKFLFFLILQWIFFAAIKVVFFKTLSLTNPGLQNILFWLSTGILATALVRRLGVISYLEAIFAAIVWFFLDLFLDLVIISPYAGLSIYAKWQFWAGYLAMALAIFFFHKKRHLALRKEIQAHNHGHH